MQNSREHIFYILGSRRFIRANLAGMYKDCDDTGTRIEAVQIDDCTVRLDVYHSFRKPEAITEMLEESLGSLKGD